MHRIGSPTATTSTLIRAVALGAALALAGGCGGPGSTVAPQPSASTSTPAATAPPTAPPASGPTTSPSAAAGPTPAASLGQTAHWVSAGTMHLAHIAPTVLQLGDGRVIAFGNSITDTYRGGPPDDSTTVVELWDPATNAWELGPALNRPRDWATVVMLGDGQPMVIGGVNASMAAYSSAYRFDTAASAWVKTGLLNTARYWGAAALLDDGRVLIAGGRYSAGNDWYGTADVALAAYSPEADVDPGPPGRPLALAEVYDPATDTWTPTGSMRIARSAPQAERLADGRVVVFGGVWDDVDDTPSAEVYDPASETFHRTGGIPVPSLSSVKALGVPVSRADWTVYPGGPSLSLDADGAAVIRGMEWMSEDGLHLWGSVRLDASSGTWSVMEDTLAVQREDPESDDILGSWGAEPARQPWAVLADGRLLYADGEETGRIELYDPTTGTSIRMPSLPTRNACAMALPLADGSVLAIPCSGTYTDAYRLVP